MSYADSTIRVLALTNPPRRLHRPPTSSPVRADGSAANVPCRNFHFILLCELGPLRCGCDNDRIILQPFTSSRYFARVNWILHVGRFTLSIPGTISPVLVHLHATQALDSTGGSDHLSRGSLLPPLASHGSGQLGPVIRPSHPLSLPRHHP